MQTLKPCPFCGGKAHYTKEIASAGLAAVVMCSDNDCCTNHAGTLQEAIDLWNTRAVVPVDGLVQSVIDFLEADEDNIYHLDPKELDTLRKFLKPAAPVDGLETVTTITDKPASLFFPIGTELVTRSQAVAIIAAERSRAEVAVAAMVRNHQRAEKAEADNAAKDARIAELEDENYELKTGPWPEWATAVLKVIRERSGYDGYDDTTEGVDLPAELEECMAELEADNAALTARVKELEAVNHNRECANKYLGEVAEENGNRAEALETQLAAAKKTLGEVKAIAWQRETLPRESARKDAQRGNAIALSGRLGEIFGKCRAALEDQP